MKSLILKATTLALGAALIIGTAGVGTAEARGGHGGGHRGHGFHGGGHRHHHFHRHHFHRPVFYFSGCYWKHGRKFCN
ncbi:MAG: hypothetical protein ACKVP7_03530 [Hyphomicrobiaceae bacterium]